jgi:molecular chaperone GrpE
MTEPKESAADKAIREALESVERLERERKTATMTATTHADEQVAFASDEGDAVAGASFQSTPPAPAEPPEPPKKKTADQLMVESLLKAKGELQAALEQTQKEAKDMFERLARVSADFENFKKRVGREKDDAIKFGNEKAFKEILPVVDNFRRAMQAAPPDGGQFVEGIRLVSKSLEDALGRFGVVGFESLGEPFDPAKHEAVGSRPHESIPSQHVCEEYQRGYMLHDRLLRPALVIVSAGRES